MDDLTASFCIPVTVTLMGYTRSAYFCGKWEEVAQRSSNRGNRYMQVPAHIDVFKPVD